MAPESDKEERGSSQYGGPLLFINKTSTTLDKTPQDSFIISSHVSKNHRKWLKEEKLKRLLASSGRAVVQRALYPAVQGLPRDGSGPSDPSARSFVPADERNAGGLRSRGVQPGQDLAKGSPALADEHNRPVYRFERGQADHDQGHQAAGPSRRRFVASNRPSLAPLRGGSDPFSATALPLAAQDHEILRLARRFFVFVASPDKKSAVWRAPIADSSSHIRLHRSIEEEADTHAILAAGYAVIARTSGPDRANSLTRGLFHKTKAVELLRDKLVNQGFSPNVTTLIRLLISLDFEASDNESALVHLRGLWTMAATTPGILMDAQELLRVSDAWISISLLKRPEISPLLYDPGERCLQSFESALTALEPELDIRNSSRPSLTDDGDSAFDRKTWGLLEAAQEIVDTKGVMDKIEDSALLQEIVPWMNKRSSAVTGYCTSGYVDNTEAAASFEAVNTEYTKRTLMAAACLCAMMFMNFRFLNMATNYNFSKTCHTIEEVLRRVSERVEKAAEQNINSDYLWLLFLTAMGNDVFSARGDMPYSPWPAIEFHNVRARLHVGEDNVAREYLRRYPHYEQMDPFLTELLSHKTPSTNIVRWSEWRIILNHA
jgi:hypothetical protein